MPVSADPTRTVDVWLESDADKPIETRPVIECRFLTRRQRSRHVEHMAQAVKLQKGDEAWKHIYDAWRVGVVGWRNQVVAGEGTPVSYDAGENLPDLLHSVFTDTEIQELAHCYPLWVQIGEADLKNSALPSRSDAVASAKAAERPVETAPATESPQTQMDA